jgi:hypothetical protein
MVSGLLVARVRRCRTATDQARSGEAVVMQSHPAADLFPLMAEDEFRALVEDIKRQGLLDPIVTLNGAILDGRNRYRACIEGGVEPMFVEWQGRGDPLAFVISRNLVRRHLTAGQRALIAAKMANITYEETLRRGSGVQNYTPSDRNEKISLQQAADMMGVGRVNVSNAKAILQHGTAEEVAAVERGEANISTVGNMVRARRTVEAEGTPEEKAAMVNGTAHPMRLAGQIWGRQKADAVDVAGAPIPSKVKGSRKGPRVPQGFTPETLAREAIRLRETGISIDKAASQLSVGKLALAQMVDVVLIADRADLSPRENAVAAKALARMNALESLPDIHASIAKIARRLWGDTSLKGGGRSRGEREVARLDRFEHALGVIVQSGLNAAKIEVPHLPLDRAVDVQRDLDRALKGIRVLREKVGEAHK